jgi:hypothetical protein
VQTVERDATDLGLARPVTIEELRELRRIRAERHEDNRPALPQQRGRVMEQLRRQMGWGPSNAAALAKECPACLARSTHWCLRNGRRTPGQICPERTQMD